MIHSIHNKSDQYGMTKEQRNDLILSIYILIQNDEPVSRVDCFDGGSATVWGQEKI